MRERLAGTAIRSITQPLLVLCLGFSLPALAGAHFLTGPPQAIDLCLAALFPIMFAVTHFYFMVKQPDRLQSEEYRLRDRSLSLVETNHGIVRDPQLLEVTTYDATNAIAALKAGGDEGPPGTPEPGGAGEDGSQQS